MNETYFKIITVNGRIHYSIKEIIDNNHIEKSKEFIEQLDNFKTFSCLTKTGTLVIRANLIESIEFIIKKLKD